MRIHQVVSDFIKKSILTTQGDMLIRGASIPERLAIGTAGAFLVSNGISAFWVDAWYGMVEGDMIVFSSGAPTWLNAGASGAFLGGNGALALPTWQNPFAFLTTEGDIIINSAAGKVRLAIGTAGQVLKTNSGATAPEWATNNTIIEQGASTETLYPFILEIGDWDMDAAATCDVTHGLGADWQNIVSVDAIIRNDNDDVRYRLPNSGAGATFHGNIFSITSTNIGLTRLTGGVFDSTSFDSTSYNRGWLTLWMKQ